LTRRTALLVLLGISGLAVYLWPAVSAPVVLWSDSALDLAWAREGVGIVSPVPPPAAGEAAPVHPAKPGYLLFLRAVLAAAPSGHETRSIVVVQSLLLWLSIAGTSMFIGRRRGTVTGVAIYLLLISFLRLRDSASIVMPEALSATLLLPITAALLEPPRIRGVLFLFGISIGLLFWVRPNVGGAAFLLAFLVIGIRREWLAFAPLLIGFLLLFAPIWILTRPRDSGTSLRGLAHTVLEGSADYYWSPSVQRGATNESGREELSRAAENWRATLRKKGPDIRRQLVWRALHGFLGTEFYDGRWSSLYRLLTTFSRVATPFLILAAAAVLLAGLWRSSVFGLGALLILLLVGQDLVLGSNPRFVLPFLPGLFIFAAAAVSSLARGPTGPRVTTVAVFGLLVAFVATHVHVLNWEWGQIESAGVHIRQRIPKGSLPREAPATFHIRIASPVVPSPAHFMVLAPDKTVLYTSENDADRREPAITAPLPRALLDANAADAVEIEVVTFGSYGEFQYLLFPVIPPPWRARAVREGSDALSPSTGIRSGALDWWAHRGLP